MIYHFGEFELDLDAVELRANGVPCSVEPQVFALLALLIENRGRLVAKEQILEKIWDGRVVSDAALSSRVKAARQAIGDDGKAQRFIRTAHRRGFRFVAEVRVSSSRQSSESIASLVATVDKDPVPSAGALPAVIAQPSLAVLPFQLVGAHNQRLEALASAIPDELILEFSRLHWLLVTARGSSFRLSPNESGFGDIGKLLGVRYCLTGRIELSASRVCVIVTLVDTADSTVVWAGDSSACVDDVHTIRDEIRSQVLAALEIRIPAHEANRARVRAIEDLDAWSAYHLGLQHIYRFNRLDNRRAVQLFERAVGLDPTFARAHAGLSFVHFQTAFMHFTDDVDAQSSLARRCAERAIELDPLDPFNNFTMGRTHWLNGDLGGGLVWLERATHLSPHYAQGLYAQAFTEALAGRSQSSQVHADLAMRLSPLDPLYYGMLGTRAWSHLVQNESPEAAHWAERAARAPGAHALIAMIAAVAHSLNQDASRAAFWAANVRERNDAFGRDVFFRAFPVQDQSARARLSDALQGLGF
jgi:DNA-binding winged helix-turn-helix (wHTH) protein